MCGVELLLINLVVFFMNFICFHNRPGDGSHHVRRRPQGTDFQVGQILRLFPLQEKLNAKSTAAATHVTARQFGTTSATPGGEKWPNKLESPSMFNSTWFSLNVMRYIVINRHNINRDVTVIRCGWRISLTRPPVPAKSDPPKPLQANQTCLGLSDRKNNHMTAIDRGKNEKSRPLDSDTVTVSRRIDWPEIDAYTWSKVGRST